MIEKIIVWSIKNRFMVIIMTLFIIVAGILAMLKTPLDAIPDLSDVQVIVYTEYPGQAPQVVEDQVTYPLTTAMLSVPYAKVVRGYSFLDIPLYILSLKTEQTYTGQGQGLWNILILFQEGCLQA